MHDFLFNMLDSLYSAQVSSVALCGFDFIDWETAHTSA